MRYLTLAFVTMGLLLTGCSGVSEIKPEKKGKELTAQEAQEAKKKMDESINHMPPDMVEKMKQMGMPPEKMRDMNFSGPPKK